MQYASLFIQGRIIRRVSACGDWEPPGGGAAKRSGVNPVPAEGWSNLVKCFYVMSCYCYLSAKRQATSFFPFALDSCHHDS